MSPYFKLTITAISSKEYLRSGLKYLYLQEKFLYFVLQQTFHKIKNLINL